MSCDDDKINNSKIFTSIISSSSKIEERLLVTLEDNSSNIIEIELKSLSAIGDAKEYLILFIIKLTNREINAILSILKSIIVLSKHIDKFTTSLISKNKSLINVITCRTRYFRREKYDSYLFNNIFKKSNNKNKIKIVYAIVKLIIY